MSSNFDATARINLDLRSFAQGAQAVTKQGGQMEKIFTNLNSVLLKVAIVEKDLAGKLRTSLGIYGQITSVTKSYAQAVQQLQKAEASGANGAKLMTAAFAQLKTALASVQGLSQKEFTRVQATIILYERMANVIKSLATAQKAMATSTQAGVSPEQKAAEAKRKSEETARKLALAEGKLQAQREKLALTASKIALDEQKLQVARDRLAQSAAKAAAAEAKLATARNGLSQATRNGSNANVAFSSSSFALRNTLGELEGSFQALFNTVTKLPTAMASAAISQEKAFAQTTRVVGEAEAAAAGLLERFQQIAQKAPISFEEVARIGQLGAQIGITADQLGDFTNTIVMFSLTTGVASDEATLLLGRIAQMQNVPISQMEQLGSAILALGTASVATDQEIIRVNASIATASNLFGLTAQETAGLSSALASLQVRPELSRGALTRVFNDLTTSVRSGGSELEKLSKVMGMTGEEVTKLFDNPATRGDFLLSFIDGLSKAATAGGDVQGVLRELGIYAVRDIDVFSRLANNNEIVAESFDRANVEFARGNELQRQSQGIYHTTSAELQNLSDAFQTLLAGLGGPLAAAIGSIASNLSVVIGFFAHLGPIVPIIGTLAAVTATAAAGWFLYQVALAKTISAMIASRELQNSLKVSSLSLKTAVDVYRGTLSATNAVSGQATQANNAQAVSSGRLATAVRAATSSHQANLVTNQRAAVAAAQGLAATTAQSRAVLSAVPGARAYAIATNQAASATLRQAAAATAAVPSTRGLALAASLTNTPLRLQATTAQQAASAQASLTQSTFLSTGALQRQQAALNGTALAQRGLATASAQSAASIRAASAASAGAATAVGSVGAAARGAAFAFGPWGIAIASAAILLGPMVSDMFDFRTEAEKLTSAAFESTGGIKALANAIQADTDAAVRAAGSQEKYNKIIADGSKEALASIGVYRAVSVTKDDIATADRKGAEAAIADAEAKIRAIEMTKGSVAALEDQAVGHGAAADAARRYLREIEKEKSTIAQSTAALKENAVALGENAKQWISDTAQAVVEQSKLADGSKVSAEALKQLSASGVDVGNVLTQSLSDPQAALKTLDAALKDVNKTASQRTLARSGSGGSLAAQMNEEAAAATRLKTFLESLRTVVASEDSAATKSLVTKKLLADALDGVGASAGSTTGHVVLTRESLEDLEETMGSAQEKIDEMAGAFEKLGTPLTAFEDAAKSAFKGAEDAVSKFSLKTKGGLDGYIKELEKIATAQREWSKNLIKISATLGPEVAAQFRKLGPEAAPAVAELADLSAKELAKLGPRLYEIGADATSDLAASIINNSGKVENASLDTRTKIADIFGKAIDGAKTAEEFAKISNEYQAMVALLGKSKVEIDISANDAKAFKSISDFSLYIDLVGQKSINTKMAIDIVKAQGDVAKIQGIIAAAEASGSLDPKGKAKLDAVLFQAQLAQLTSSVAALVAGGKLDAKGKPKLDDAEYRAKVLALTQFLASTEGAGLLNPKGKAELSNAAYIAQMQALANIILGEEAAGKFDANGDGKLNPTEFKALLEALKGAVAAANKGKLDPRGKVILTGVGDFQRQLGGIVQAAYNAGSRIQSALTRSATVSVGYLYYQKNSPPKTMQAATGGWINGPGGPKSDVIPAMLSNGEFVVNAAAARQFGALLEVINSNGGRGMAGVARKLMEGAPQSKPVRLAANTGNTMLNSGMVQQAPPESVSVNIARMVPTGGGPTNIFNINNQYPQAEATSVTINRSLAYAATISGV